MPIDGVQQKIGVLRLGRILLIGGEVMYEYNDSAYNLYVSPQARFRFTQDAINAIRNYYLNFSPTLYYTFDISVSNEYNTTVSCY